VKSIPVPEGCLNFWPRPCWKLTVTGGRRYAFVGVRIQSSPSFAKKIIVMLFADQRNAECCKKLIPDVQ
jgi:hypothetical protein